MVEQRASESVRWVLLAGGLKAAPLAQGLGSSILDVLLTPEQTVLEHWMEVILAGGSASCPVEGVWIVGGGQAPRPVMAKRDYHCRIEVVNEPRSLRGPAGIVRDVCSDWRPDQLLIVAEGKRCLMGGVGAMVREHLERGSEVTVAANADGTPAGMYMLRRSALETVSSAGFMDLKEQWLKKTRDRKADVRVHRLAGWGSMPLRTREQFLTAAMVLGGTPPDGRLARFSVFEASCATQERPFIVLGRGAVVGAGATVRDSVVMERAEIGAGAVVVRSIVAAGVTVEPGAEVVDAIVTLRGVVSESAGRKGSEKQSVRA